jgi:acyl-CoA synthetase (AMP-forming)/AMP-acid ligase II
MSAVPPRGGAGHPRTADGGSAPLPADLPENLGDLVRRPGLGSRLALVDLRRPGEPVELTADEFDERVRAIARGLLRWAPDRASTELRIGFLAENRWELFVGQLATMYAGAVAVPINHKLAAATVEHIIADAGVDLVFHDAERAHLVPAGVPTVGFDDRPETGGAGPGPGTPAPAPSTPFEAFGDPGPLEPHRPGPGGLAEILYTSGSTGMPKGVPLDHRGQLWALSKYTEPVTAGEATGSSLIVAPLFHMNAIVFSGVCLLNGITVVLQPRFDAAAYIDAVARYRCTLLTGVPTMFAMVAGLPPGQRPDDLSFVQRLMIGSAPMSDALLAEIHQLFPNAVYANGYGTTEAGPSVFGPHPDGRPRPPLSIGYPFDDVEWRLVDGPSPDEGALELRTGALTAGYLNRPEANAERFVDGWYRTGDVMRRDAEGFFYFVSRVDDMFVCGGENIYPAQVEELLNAHPGVQQSLVVGAPDDLKGQVPVAFVVPVAGQEPAEDELKAFVIEQAPAYLHPRRVVFRPSLPLGGTQKIDRRTLEAEAAELMVQAGRASR